MNKKLLADVAVLAGEIMLSCGAEAYRVEDTMCRILKVSGLVQTESFVTSTGIFASLSDNNEIPITVMKRVETRSTNLNRVALVNEVSRRLCENEISVEDAYLRLEKIKTIEQYKDYVVWIAMSISTVFFCMVLGGSPMDCLVSGVNGCCISGCMILMKKIKMNFFVSNMIASLIVAFNTMIAITFIQKGFNMEAIITGSIMPLVPGVAITNAIRDTLQGDYMAGGAKAIEAFVIAVSIAVGIGAGLGLHSFIFGVAI